MTNSRAPTGTAPFSPYEWLLASRYLRARRKEGFISVIAGFSFVGIVLGVMTLIVVMAVMNGFRKELFAKILGLNGHVIAMKIGDTFDDYPDVASRLAGVPGVRTVMPLIEGQVLISSPSQTAFSFVRSVNEASIKSLPLVANNVRFGTLDGFDKQQGIALGSRLASTLRVNVGDQVTLLTPRGAATPFGTAPRTKQYMVSSIFELGMAEYDRTLLFMPLAEGQRFFAKNGEVDMIEALVDDPEHVGNMLPVIRHAGGPTIQVTDWRQRNETFFTVLDVERTVMFIILVAALNIISGMMMLVKDKGRDIAILRTMGATKGAMMRVFLITGASIGIVGTIAGFVLGVLFCTYIEQIREFVSWLTRTELFNANIYYLTRLPAEMDVRETAAIVIMALALSVLATLYPSWRASRLDPVEALRYE